MKDKFKTKYPEVPQLSSEVMEWAMEELKRLKSVGE